MYNASNNARSRLVQSITATDTSLVVEDGSVFPEPPFLVSIDDEIIEVRSKSGNTLGSLVRGAENTTASTHSAKVFVENRFTAGTYHVLADEILRTQQDLDTAKQQLTNTIADHKADKQNPHGVTVAQIGAETPSGAQAKVNAHESKSAPHSGHATVSALNAVKSDLDSHIGDENNPHGITPSQIGAETPAGAQAKVDAHEDKASPHSGHATVTALNITNSDLSSHKNNKSNPHGVTHAQTSPAEVDPTSTNTTKDKHVSNALAKGWEDHRKASAPHSGHATVSALNSHIENKSNPHGVTVSQIGAETPSGAQSKVDAHANLKTNPHSVTHSQTNPAGATSGSDTTKDKHISNQDYANWENHRSASSPHSGHATTSALNSHVGNKNNPHGVTASQVGAPTKSEFDMLKEMVDGFSGFIIEMGENEDGTYVRWDNGLQICWFDHRFANDSAGTLEHSRAWPAPFVDAPVVATHVRAALTGAPTPEVFNSGNPPTATDTGNIKISDSGVYTRLYVIAIGRWE